MNIDLIRLNNNIISNIEVDEVYSFKPEELEGTEIIRLDDIKISGNIYKNALDDVELNLNVKGVMVLPCALTLKEVDYPFDIDIEGSAIELLENMEENEINFQNTLDILPIIWENILMEVPMRVISPDVDPDKFEAEGEGWKYITEENTVSPLSELMDIIDE